MPTYELNTAKGPIYVEGPPAATKEQIIAIYNSSIQTATDNRVNQFENTLNQNFEDRTAAALETAKARKATIGDYLGEIPKGLVSGASSMLESGALGLAAILPEEAENVVRGGIKSVGKAVQDYVPADFNLGSTLQKSIPRSVSEATGSFLGLAGTSMINPLAGVTLAVSAGAGEASERAREDGASLEDRNLAALLGTIPGALELLPIKFLSVINKAQKQNFTDALVRIVEQTGIEGAQEAVSSIAQNLIAREVYKPEQSLTEGTAEEAALGGSVGAIIQSTLELIAPRKRGGKSSTDSETLAIEDMRDKRIEDQRQGLGSLQIEDQRVSQARAAIGEALDTDGAVSLEKMQSIVTDSGIPFAELEGVVAEEMGKRGSDLAQRAKAELDAEEELKNRLQIEGPESLGLTSDDDGNILTRDQKIQQTEAGRVKAKEDEDARMEALRNEAKPKTDDSIDKTKAKVKSQYQINPIVEFNVKKDLAGQAKQLDAPVLKGGVNEQTTEIKPDASRDGVQPPSEDVVNANNIDLAGNADTKKGAGGIKSPAGGGLGSTRVVSGLPDGTEGAKPTALEAAGVRLVETSVPNEQYLADKNKAAAKNRKTAKKDTYESNIGRPATVSAYFEDADGNRTVNLNPEILANVKGALGEEATRGTGVKADRLRKSIEKDGYDPKLGAILVEVREDGTPFIVEGNNRLAEAISSGRESIPVEIKYIRGGEKAKGILDPMEVGIEMYIEEKLREPKPKAKPFNRNAVGSGTNIKGAAKATIPTGVKGVASKKAVDPKKTEAAQVARLYDEETPDAVKKIFGASKTTNPLSEPDNKKIKDKILQGATKSDKSKKEDVPVIAYLRAFSNPFDGIEMALFDKVNATPIAKQAATYKDKAGNPVKDTDVASKADVEARRGMGGVASKKGELSSADRTIAWARANLSKEANVKISKRLQQLEDNQKNTMVFEGGPDRVVASQAAGLLNVRKNLESLVLSNYTDPMELVKAYPDIYPSKAAVEKAIFDDPSFGINVQLGLNIGAVVGLDVPINPAVETAVNEGDLGAVLTIIADTNPVKQIRQLAEAYAKLVGSTKIVIKKDLKADDGRPVAGLFDPKTNTISLNKEAGINTHTIMHEMSHAVASADIANPESSAGQQFNKLFNNVKEYLGTAYGAKDAQEFLAEAQSNPEFRADLASINIKGEKVTALQRYYNIMQNILSRYVPFIQSRNITLLQEVDSLVDALLAPAPKYRNANQMAMSSTVDGVKSFAKNVIGKTQQSVNKGSRKQWGYDAADFMSKAGSQGKGLLMKLTAMQGLGDIAESVGLGKLGYKLDDLLSRQRGGIQTANKRLQTKVESILKTLEQSSPEKTRKVTAALDDVIYNTEYGATIFQVDPLKSELDYVNKKTGAPIFDTSGNNLQAIWKAQRASWNAMGTDGQKAYKDMQSVYRASYNRLKDVIFGQIDNLVGDKNSANKLKKDIFSRMFKQSTLDVYFPLMREGDYVLRFNAKNPKSEREKTTLITYTTKTERDEAEKFYKKTGDYIDFKTEDTGVTASMFKSGGADLGFATETLNILDKAKTKEGDAIPIEVKDQIMRLFVNSLPETSFAKSLQKRKGTPGYMQDSVYALKEKGASLASQTAKLEYAAKLRMYEQELRDAKPLAIPQAKSLVGKGTKKLSSSFDEVRNELLKRAEFGRQGAKNQTVEGIARRLNQMAFMYTIGFNTSSALVNLSQIPLFVAPYLGGQYGYAETTKAISNAYGNVNFGGKRGGKTNSILNYYDISDDGTFTLKKGLDLPAGKEAELKRMTLLVKTASERGLLGQSFLAEAMGLNEASPSKKGGKLGNAMDNASVLSAWLFNHGEQLNRQVTLMASFNLALDAQTGTKNIEQAVQDAIYNTQKTNGGTFLETAPSLLNTGVGRVAGMYKSYGLQMYYVMFQTAKVAFDSDKGKLFGKQGSIERKTAWKQLIGMHGSALFFAGIQGLPLYGAVRLMVNLFMLDDEEEDFDTIVRQYVGEGWYKGAVNQMTGMDVASRMALTGLLIQENRYNNDPSLEESIGFYLGGPALSVANRLYRGGTDLFEGNIERGIESILPAGIANAWRASPLGRYQTEGVKTRRGDFIYDDITGGELAGLFFGIQPTELTFRQERNNITKGIDIAVGKKRSKLSKKLYMAMRVGDFPEQIKIRKEMQKFSARHPEAKIDGPYLERSLKKHRETSKLMAKYNGITLSPTYRKTLEEFREGYDK